MINLQKHGSQGHEKHSLQKYKKIPNTYNINHTLNYKMQLSRWKYTQGKIANFIFWFYW